MVMVAESEAVECREAPRPDARAFVSGAVGRSRKRRLSHHRAVGAHDPSARALRRVLMTSCEIMVGTSAQKRETLKMASSSKFRSKGREARERAESMRTRDTCIICQIKGYSLSKNLEVLLKGEGDLSPEVPYF